jgi:predicted GH43/DUF377 family glycosyl hydrolase
MLEVGTKIRFIKDGWRVATGVVLKNKSILQVYPYTRTSTAKLNPKGFIVHRGPFRSLEEWRSNFEQVQAMNIDNVVIWKRHEKYWQDFDYNYATQTIKNEQKIVRILNSVHLQTHATAQPRV